ncbi:MAG: DNA translocase FtsK [Ruminococcus sp.]|nr:DNA translocase FtsK [Ruminococcus sp.]
MANQKQSTKKKTENKAFGKNTSGKKKSAPRAEVAENKSHLSTRIKSLIFFGAAILFTFLIFIPGQNVWMALRSFFFGMFGFSIFLIPVLLGYIAVITAKEQQIAHLKGKAILCTSIVLFTGALLYVALGSAHSEHNFFACIGKLYYDAASSTSYMPIGAGFIGGLLGYPLSVLFSPLPALLTCIVVLLVMIFVIANLSLKDIARAATKVGRGVNHVRTISEEKVRQRRQRRVETTAQNIPRDVPKQSADTFSDKAPVSLTERRNKGASIDIPLDNDQTLVQEKPQSVEKTEKQVLSDIPKAPDKSKTTDENNALSEDLLNIINRANKPFVRKPKETPEIFSENNDNKNTEKSRLSEVAKAEKASMKQYEDDAINEIEQELAQAGYSASQGETENGKTEKAETKYHYPPIQLLSLADNSNDRNAMEEMQNNAKKLIETLDSFNVKASIVNICRGPSVTRYELAPAPGVKISKITNLSDDIALNLAANGVRIEAPIPGKAAVGIEVPNKVVSMVSMRELIDSDEFRNGKSRLTCVLGKDISGSIVVTDLAKMPHLLIAGTTGSGKSVCVNSILMSILYKANPDEVKLLLVDPKMVEFSKYKGVPHLLIPVVSDAKKAAGALSWAVSEMLQRYKIFSEYDCKNIDSYNELIEDNLRYIAENPPEENEEGELIQPVLEKNGLPVAKEKMPQIVIAIDELADLMMAAPSEVEESICRLAQMARAAGMHLLIATQRPTVNVITGLIKANIPSRIALKVSSNMDSRTILDLGGAEKLIGRGDMLFSPVGAPKPVRVQGCYASDEEIENVTGFIKKSYSAQYNAEIEEKIKRIAAEEIATGKKGDDGGADAEGIDIDAKMEEAIKCVIEAGQASTSLLQRRLKVGYARAGRMIDDMEQMGIVGPHQGSKPRDVLMTYNEWLERRNILGSNETE